MIDKELVNEIRQATKQAAEKLFLETGECFYYFSLITSGEAHAPYVSAWSKEQLDSFPEEMRNLVKWSYADSPYCEYGLEYFSKVETLFANRPDIVEMPEFERNAEYELRLQAMEDAIRALDKQGLFGAGKEREQIVVNVEVMPPDKTNRERAIRLNPQIALNEWLKEAAE